MVRRAAQLAGLLLVVLAAAFLNWRHWRFLRAVGMTRFLGLDAQRMIAADRFGGEVAVVGLLVIGAGVLGLQYFRDR